MKFSFSAIGRNLLHKLPVISLLAVMVVATTRFDHFPAHSDQPPTVSADTTGDAQWARGYAGEVPVVVGVGADERIDTVMLGEHNETRAYIKKLQREGLFDAWDGMTLIEAERASVQAVSGATFSSSAVIANVKAEAARLANIEPTQTEQFTLAWWVKQALVWVVLVLAILSYLIPAKMKRWRWVLLLATVGVLGFWQGAFLSMQMLYNYVVGGSSMLQITLTVILVLAIAAPLMFNRSFYCQYLCPFGMLQEAAGKIPLPKIIISHRSARVFSWTRRITFVLFVVLVWVNPHFEPGEWEPFSAFIAVRDVINFGSVSVLIIAGVSVIVSVFMPRAWCRVLCPMGEFFSILQRKPAFRKSLKR